MRKSQFLSDLAEVFENVQKTCRVIITIEESSSNESGRLRKKIKNFS